LMRPGMHSSRAAGPHLEGQCLVCAP
jgi:hypothetical protein